MEIELIYQNIDYQINNIYDYDYDEVNCIDKLLVKITKRRFNIVLSSSEKNFNKTSAIQKDEEKQWNKLTDEYKKYNNTLESLLEIKHSKRQKNTKKYFKYSKSMPLLIFFFMVLFQILGLILRISIFQNDENSIKNIFIYIFSALNIIFFILGEFFSVRRILYLIKNSTLVYPDKPVYKYDCEHKCKNDEIYNKNHNA